MFVFCAGSTSSARMPLRLQHHCPNVWVCQNTTVERGDWLYSVFSWWLVYLQNKFSERRIYYQKVHKMKSEHVILIQWVQQSIFLNWEERITKNGINPLIYFTSVSRFFDCEHLIQLWYSYGLGLLSRSWTEQRLCSPHPCECALWKGFLIFEWPLQIIVVQWHNEGKWWAYCIHEHIHGSQTSSWWFPCRCLLIEKNY